MNAWMRAGANVLAAQLAAFVLVSPVRAGTGLNGTNPRPFYVIGHNPNTLSDAEAALQCAKPGDPCANALEPDVMVLPDGATYWLPPIPQIRPGWSSTTITWWQRHESR